MTTPKRPFLSQSPGVDLSVNPAWREARERAYDATFGKCDKVLHEMIPVIPHVDVFRYPPSDARPSFTLVTSGMSDRPMPAEPAIPRKLLRAELIFYCSEMRDGYAEMLRKFAHFPHDVNTWIGNGHTVPINELALSILGNSRFSTLLFLLTIVRSDRAMAEAIVIDGAPLNLLWVVPITAAETQLAVSSGSRALLQKFSEHEHPVVFNADRQSYV